MKKSNLLSVITICVMMFSGALFAKGASMSIVFQMNEGAPEKIEGGLRNIKHLVEAAEKQGHPIKVSVILFGSALPEFQKAKADEKTAKAFKELLEKDKNVSWFACQNTLDRVGLKLTDLFEGFKTVPSGIFEVAKLQTEGYVYLRP